MQDCGFGEPASDAVAREKDRIETVSRFESPATWFLSAFDATKEALERQNSLFASIDSVGFSVMALSLRAL
jgi:hypothetical protein